MVPPGGLPYEGVVERHFGNLWAAKDGEAREQELGEQLELFVHKLEWVGAWSESWQARSRRWGGRSVGQRHHCGCPTPAAWNQGSHVLSA